MARFVPLNFRAGGLCLAAGMGAAFFCAGLRADPAMTNGAPQAATTSPATTPPPKPPMTNVVTAPRLPDTFNRYGKILAPTDDVAHPVKLNVQFPGIGEMKIPSQEELQVRDKLEQLATLSDADIHKQLDQWPPYTKMKLGDQGQLLMRIQQFRDLRSKMAQQKAHDMGLLTLTNDQKARFEKEYWDKKLQMDHELAKQFEPAFKAREQKLEDELFREFSTIPQSPLAKNPAPPPAPPSPANKPPQPPALVAPVVQLKDTSTGQQPVGQAPPR